HPDRAASIAPLAGKFGRTVLYSELSFSAEADIIVVDVMGVLFELYGLADAAFIGGSMVPMGGQNILEPAIWGIPALHGPYMEDFADHTARLDSLGAAYRVSSPSDVESLWRKASSGCLPDCAKAVSNFFSEKSGASARAWRCFEKYL
ncbi:MAG: 3-deoxy-D-manno-octulosonic acid transferase, partial [Synergistaceae bacterium]|nr:3-deoxy-D-manno-octulosonic acid transferase [Synergistaceae bacterium]